MKTLYAALIAGAWVAALLLSGLGALGLFVIGRRNLPAAGSMAA